MTKYNTTGTRFDNQHMLLSLSTMGLSATVCSCAGTPSAQQYHRSRCLLNQLHSATPDKQENKSILYSACEPQALQNPAPVPLPPWMTPSHSPRGSFSTWHQPQWVFLRIRLTSLPHTPHSSHLTHTHSMSRLHCDPQHKHSLLFITPTVDKTILQWKLIHHLLQWQ